MIRSRASLPLALGFFALASQTVLFRDFLASFEGGELAIGAFFGSWLVWIAAGAWLGRLAADRLPAVNEQFGSAALLYIPAFLIQRSLILGARGLLGVEAWELFPYGRMFAAAFVFNAPVSLATGALFTLICRRLSPARVYAFEALGGFAGGLAVIALLAAGKPNETASLLAFAALAAGAAIFQAAESREKGGRSWESAVSAALSAGFLALVVLGGGRVWAGRADLAAWSRLLPSRAWQGRFDTAQASYLYGERDGQFLVMAWGGVSEALPPDEGASEIAALNLAQKPDAKSALVMGPGSLGVCLRLLKLPQMERVTWLHPDPEYPRALANVLPEKYKKAVAKIEIPNMEARAFARNSHEKFDMILLDFPDATTLALNRHSTQEFFCLMKGLLTDGGILSAKTSGVANYMGGELGLLGASTLSGLEATYAHVVIKPGDETWMIASDGGQIDEQPARLRDRFAAIEGTADIYPPEGLMSLYLPDRIDFQRQKYDEARKSAGEAFVANTDDHPKGMLYALLLALRHAGMRSAPGLPAALTKGGFAMGVAAVLLFLALRAVFALWSPRHAAQAPPEAGVRTVLPSAFDAGFLAFSAGAAGMALNVALLFFYQSRFGSLFVHIGLASSLFMLGAFAGSEGMRQPLERKALGRLAALALCLLFGASMAAVVGVCREVDSRAVFFALFFLSGASVGAFFPVAAEWLGEAGLDATGAGARLEGLDHLGGAAGALLCGLIAIPAIGGPATLGLAALLLAANVVSPVIERKRTPAPDFLDAFDRAVRPVGFTLLGAGAFLLISSRIAASVAAGDDAQRLAEAARAMASPLEVREQTTRLADGTALAWFEVEGEEGTQAGYIFGTAPFAKGVVGYGGPIRMAAYTGLDGELKDFRIVRSSETPSYLAALQDWEKKLPGRNLFAPEAFEGVDAVTGATLSSSAILETLARAGRGFASQALGKDVGGEPQTAAGRGWAPDRNFLVLLAFAVGAIFIRWRPTVWGRRAFLLAAVAIPGVWLNLQFSSHHVMSLLSGAMPAAALTGSFFMIVVLPVLVLLFGNVYCGWMCPFGALQELIGDLRPAALQTGPSKVVWRWGRAMKYILLFLLAAAFALTRNFETLTADPLISVFSAFRGRAAALTAAGVLALSFFYPRFWCRSLCPAGAFLSALNALRPLKKWLPFTRPGRCDLGVRSADDLDCLMCDRCNLEKI